MQSLRLNFVGPVPGISAERTVTIPRQGTVRIRLTGDELLGKREPLVPLTGVVRIEQGGPPVKGATVVFGSYPYRYETTTDENGRFNFPRVAANRGGVLFIDAPNPQAAPPFDRITVTRPVAPLPRPGARATAGEQVFEIPRLTSGATTSIRFGSPTAAGTPRTGSIVTQLQDFNYDFQVCGTNYTQDEFQYVTAPVVEAYRHENGQFFGPIDVTITDASVERNGLAVVNMTFPYQGDFLVFIQYTPFVFDAAGVTILGSGPAKIVFSPKNNMTTLVLTVLDQAGNRVPGNVEVNFPSWPLAVDPYETLTNFVGDVPVNCVSRGPNIGIDLVRDHLLLEINDPTYGCFNGFVTLSSSRVQVSLNPNNCGQ